MLLAVLAPLQRRGCRNYLQMYTALRLLGVPTAFVEVEGEDHGIMEPVKRTKWINTIIAWFQRFIKNDDSWWNAVYSPKKL